MEHPQHLQPAVASAQLTFPSGLAVIAFLPSSCVPGNNILICSGLNAPAGSPFEIDARFNTAFPPGASFSSFFTATDGATLTVNGTGP